MDYLEKNSIEKIFTAAMVFNKYWCQGLFESIYKILISVSQPAAP
jgi:hypothetical protein